MDRPTRFFVTLGAVNAGLAVALGAFGTHALTGSMPPRFLEIFQTGTQYHFYHGLGLFGVALVASLQVRPRLVYWAGRSMVAGIALFSGSLYALALTQRPGFGAVTPLGGLCFLAAWGILAVSAVRDD
ncbi:MAG: DUF423 domain-containing protein [Gemmatimonadota bacterium]|nr:DUF423 domain-containing protein [Gemmatimonadota bacterium]